MVKRYRTAVVGAALALAAACARDATSPSAVATPSYAKYGAPGAKGYLNSSGKGSGRTLLRCTPQNPQYGTARIGPSGGELIVGPHRLIIPPGALTQTVDVSGTVPSDNSVSIYLQPSGLQFKKPAGLILDASSCTDVPDVVYVSDLLVPETYIQATYSNWWHTVAAPIDHFSGYAIAFSEE